MGGFRAFHFQTVATGEVQRVVVVCPKCKTRLNVEETRLLPQGSRFKCPKCSMVLVVKKPSIPTSPVMEKPSSPAKEKPEMRPEKKWIDLTVRHAAPEHGFIPSEGQGNELIEKAKRLARTIINTIYLYNPTKVDEAIRRGDFYSVCASEVMEGRSLYENRIPAETRNKADFFKAAIDNFIAAKKRVLHL
jgi:predicted Zn finger-like uncharacterized protein